MAFKILPPVGLYTRPGIEHTTLVLLPVETATKLLEKLRLSLASDESVRLAAYPREICVCPVQPQMYGREQYVSFHLDAGPKPMSKWQLRRQEIRKTIFFVLAVYGFVSGIRAILLHVGA